MGNIIKMAIFQAFWPSLPSLSSFLCSSEEYSTFWNTVSPTLKPMCAYKYTDMLTCTLASETPTLQHLSEFVPFFSLLRLLSNTQHAQGTVQKMFQRGFD